MKRCSVHTVVFLGGKRRVTQLSKLAKKRGEHSTADSNDLTARLKPGTTLRGLRRLHFVCFRHARARFAPARLTSSRPQSQSFQTHSRMAPCVSYRVRAMGASRRARHAACRASRHEQVNEQTAALDDYYSLLQVNKNASGVHISCQGLALRHTACFSHSVRSATCSPRQAPRHEPFFRNATGTFASVSA
jgi:hypothetical protein